MVMIDTYVSRLLKEYSYYRVILVLLSIMCTYGMCSYIIMIGY